jgi:hypothetical protein
MSVHQRRRSSRFHRRWGATFPCQPSRSTSSSQIGKNGAQAFQFVRVAHGVDRLDAPKSYLLQVVAWLCVDQATSARANAWGKIAKPPRIKPQETFVKLYRSDKTENPS